MLLRTLEVFRDGCNFVSEHIFGAGCVDRFAVNGAVYHELRDRFGLRSQMAQSVVRVVVSHYSAMVTNALKARREEAEYEKAVSAEGLKPPRRKRGRKGKKESTEHHSVTRGENVYDFDGNEWRRIRYRALQYELVWNRDYSITDGCFSVNTLEGRVKLVSHDGDLERIAGGREFRYGESKLQFRDVTRGSVSPLSRTTVRERPGSSTGRALSRSAPDTRPSAGACSSAAPRPLEEG